jgi:tetratricopeptide (TPR) repeat protein
MNVARVFLDQGRTEDAHDSLQQAEQLYRELDMQSHIADCHHSRGFILAREGKLDEAEAELEQALAVYRTIDTPLREARSTTELARIKRLQGDIAEAEELVQRVLELAGDRETTETAEARRELAMCRRESDPKDAEQLLRTAADFFRKSEEQTSFAATCRVLGDLLLENGDAKAAAEAFREGVIAVEEPL